MNPFLVLRSTTDYLDKKVSFDTTRYTMDVWAQNEARIISTSNNLNYIPTEFSDEHVEIFEDAKEIDCVNCKRLGIPFLLTHCTLFSDPTVWAMRRRRNYLHKLYSLRWEWAENASANLQ